MDRPLVPLGKPRAERADAQRNREILLEAARAMIAEHGVGNVTMDGLAERAGLGKGTVFRRFGTRAGIFRALIEEDERRFQERVLSGPPPLGPGADPAQRLIAYGRARILFLLEHLALARASMDRDKTLPSGQYNLTQVHTRMLLGRIENLDLRDLDTLAVQLAGALEGPILLFLSYDESEPLPHPAAAHPLSDSWQALVERLLRIDR